MNQKEISKDTSNRQCAFIIFSTDAGNGIDIELFDDPHLACEQFDKEVDKEFTMVRKEFTEAFNFKEERTPFRAILTWNTSVWSMIRSGKIDSLKELLYILFHRSEYCSQHYCQLVLGDTIIE